MTTTPRTGRSGSALVLGPLLRHVDETSATIWVETADAATVAVSAGDRSWAARTFAVHGHHYALVDCVDMAPGSQSAYAVRVGGEAVWPPPREEGSPELPPTRMATLEPGKKLRLAFGSCRTSVNHDRDGNRTHGVDALHAYALALAGVTAPAEALAWPDLLLLLGDQVYADETTEEMQAFIASRRDLDEPPGEELKDFEEYAHLYALAWRDPVDRWLLATVPSAMIFDDHDVRDDWNTSARWRSEMEELPWWRDRIVAALASYWVYQHLGNLSREDRARDEVYRLVLEHDGPEELDVSEVLDALAERADAEPQSYRWSYSRDVAGTRLVVVDTRAARILDGRRSMLDPGETAWLDSRMVGGFEHLLIGTSLPFLLPTGLHHLEAFSEALADGAWGRWGARLGETLRQVGDLEHWAAFQRGFTEVSRMAMEVASGQRGPAPRSVTFLSGDVHHSYVSQVRDVPGGGVILQAVCSPIRNPLARVFRFATAALSYGIAAPMGALAARSAKVPSPPFTWERVKGPWFDNNLATLEVTEDGMELCWAKGDVRDGRQDLPALEPVAKVVLGADGRARPA